MIRSLIAAFGIVMWGNATQCGIAFDSPLEPHTLKILQHKVTLAAGLPPQFKAALEDWINGYAR